MEAATQDITREMIVDGIAEMHNEGSVAKPYVMSHGTLECYSLKESRKFYEEFLGMECVRHAKPAMLLRCGLKFHVVCVEVGDSVHPQNVLNHWGIDVLSEAEVDRIYKAALDAKDKYKIREIMEPKKMHGVYSFYMEDLDHNWWEVQSSPAFVHDDVFDFGDRFDENGEPL